MACKVDDFELPWKAMIKPWYNKNNWLSVDTTKKLSAFKIAWFGELNLGYDKISISKDISLKLNKLVNTLTKEGVITQNIQTSKLPEMRQMHMLLMAYMAFSKQPWIIRP